MRTSHPRRVFAVTSAVATVTWVTLGSLSDWGAFWCAWIVAGFMVPEMYGLIVNPAFTLSRNLWSLEGLDFGHPLDFATWTPLHYAVSIIVWLLFGWLSIHIPFGWAR
jgi:hypothetical protein